MTLTKRLRVGVMSLVATVSVAGSAAAAAPKALTDGDARAYAAAFQAVEEGDFVGAQLQAAQIHDKSLSGYLSFGALMHPSAHKASFDELCGWLSRFRDLPLAQRVFSLAARRKPADAEPPPVPQVAVKPQSVAQPKCTLATPRGLKVRAREQTTIKLTVRNVDAGSVAKITLPGGKTVSAKTNSKGVATLKVNPPKTGTARITIAECSDVERLTVRPARRVVAQRVPRVTG
jgi:hypothetical protein